MFVNGFGGGRLVNWFTHQVAMTCCADAKLKLRVVTPKTMAANNTLVRDFIGLLRLFFCFISGKDISCI